jgi:hypothetical protein
MYVMSADDGRAVPVGGVTKLAADGVGRVLADGVSAVPGGGMGNVAVDDAGREIANRVNTVLDDGVSELLVAWTTLPLTGEVFMAWTMVFSAPEEIVAAVALAGPAIVSCA